MSGLAGELEALAEGLEDVDGRGGSGRRGAVRIGGDGPSWQNSMETNGVQQVKPLASRSAACFLTRPANSVRGKCWSS